MNAIQGSVVSLSLGRVWGRGEAFCAIDAWPLVDVLGSLSHRYIERRACSAVHCKSACGAMHVRVLRGHEYTASVARISVVGARDGQLGVARQERSLGA